MAAGVPVIASDAPINREIVVEGESGYLIPLLERSGRADRARHTDRILVDNQLFDSLATAARKFASYSYGNEAMVNQYADLYAGRSN
jgi:glycosyltransferase involved in cell wall biosynthesis